MNTKIKKFNEMYGPDGEEDRDSWPNAPKLDSEESSNMTQADKAKKWDDLVDSISKFYETDNDGNDVVSGDLGDIGEICARKLGFL